MQTIEEEANLQKRPNTNTLNTQKVNLSIKSPKGNKMN